MFGGDSCSCFGLGAPLALALLAAFALTLAFALGALGAAFGLADATPFGVNGLVPDFETQAGDGSVPKKNVTNDRKMEVFKWINLMYFNGETKSIGLLMVQIANCLAWHELPSPSNQPP